MAEGYQVKIPQFEGPLELLLQLIEKRKLFVNELSLSAVTDDYVSRVRGLEQPDVADTAQFIVIAATLILIKSRSLLPNLELTAEEEKEIGDLEARLKTYNLYKEIGALIKERYGRSAIFPAPDRDAAAPVFAPDRQVTPEAMRAAMRGLLERLPEEKESLPEVTVRKVISIEEMIDSLSERIASGLRTSFREFSAGSSGDAKESKVHVIVSFLAMLELVRGGLLACSQREDFEDIEMWSAPRQLEVRHESYGTPDA